MGYYYALATTLMEAFYHGLYKIDCEGVTMPDVIDHIDGLPGYLRRFGVSALILSAPDRVYSEDGRTLWVLLDDVKAEDERGDFGGERLLTEQRFMADGANNLAAMEIGYLMQARYMFRNAEIYVNAADLVGEVRLDDNERRAKRMALRARSVAYDNPGVVPARAWIERAVGVIRDQFGSRAVESQLGVIQRRYARQCKAAWAESAKRAEARNAAIDARACA